MNTVLLYSDEAQSQTLAVLGNTDAPYIGVTEMDLLRQILIALCNS